MTCVACACEVAAVNDGGRCLACWIEGREPMAAELLAIAADFTFAIECACVQLRRPKP